MYDPTVGRWTTEDPIEFEGGDTDLYRYVGNSPTDGIDPMGLQVRMDQRPRPRPPVLTPTQPQTGYPNKTPFDSNMPRSVYEWPGWYFSRNFTPGNLISSVNGVSYPKRLIFDQGCVGLAKLRIGSPIYVPGDRHLPGIWFIDPNAA
jgi:hypothetical protein